MRMKKERLANMIGLAEMYHFGQYDYQGMPYITHCMRVLGNLHIHTHETLQCAAVGHDLLEDTACYEDEIIAAAGQEVLDIIKLLTKTKGQDYQEYLNQVATNKYAIMVKLADLKDNSDPFRQKGTIDEYNKTMEKYKNADKFLRDMLERILVDEALAGM